VGKLKFIQELKLLPTGHINFIKRLSTVQERLAHKIENVGFTWIGYFKAEKAKLSQRLS